LRSREFKGILPPLITPMKRHYEVDEESLRKIIDFCIEGGVHGIIPTGSTGEFARLSVEERKRVVEVTIDAANGRVPVIVGTASPSTDLTIELSRHAQDAGAEGLQVVAPYYGKPTTEELFEHFKAIAEAVDIPIFVYNNPWTSGVDITPPLLARLAKIDNIRYVKECSGDTRRVSQIIRLTDGKMTVLVGSDDNMLDAFLLGDKAWVSGIAKFIPEPCVKLYELCVEKEDFKSARELYYRMIPLGELVESSGKFVQYIKAGVELVGLQAGPPRRPLLTISQEERQVLERLVGSLNSKPAQRPAEPLSAGVGRSA